ncbi:hypothetical protein D6821_01245 [Candidatus Parcubacteria bacterium]|nr:MAG: hypothetical protein D6821_01245 [Candidatus Parcubacteria bacterium]
MPQERAKRILSALYRFNSKLTFADKERALGLLRQWIKEKPRLRASKKLAEKLAQALRDDKNKELQKMQVAQKKVRLRALYKELGLFNRLIYILTGALVAVIVMVPFLDYRSIRIVRVSQDSLPSSSTSPDPAVKHLGEDAFGYLGAQKKIKPIFYFQPNFSSLPQTPQSAYVWRRVVQRRPVFFNQLEAVNLSAFTPLDWQQAKLNSLADGYSLVLDWQKGLFRFFSYENNCASNCSPLPSEAIKLSNEFIQEKGISLLYYHSPIAEVGGVNGTKVIYPLQLDNRPVYNANLSRYGLEFKIQDTQIVEFSGWLDSRLEASLYKLENDSSKIVKWALAGGINQDYFKSRNTANLWLSAPKLVYLSYWCSYNGEEEELFLPAFLFEVRSEDETEVSKVAVPLIKDFFLFFDPSQPFNKPSSTTPTTINRDIFAPSP